MRRSIFLAGLWWCSPALAQTPEETPDPDRDTITIGVGGAVMPRYEGSGDYRIIPAGAISGKISNISFTTAGTALFVDVIPQKRGTKLVLGPAAHLSLNRSSLRTTRAPQIVALGKVPVALEMGGHAGVTRTGVVTSAYDSVTFDVAVTRDVTGVHGSAIVTPSVSYGTPLSRRAYVGMSISADHVGSGYARTYFGVTPAQSAASGLPAYAPDAGFKDVSFGLFGAISLSGDLRRGLSVFALGSYSKLLGQFGRSPVVRNRNQLFGALGLAYTF